MAPVISTELSPSPSCSKAEPSTVASSGSGTRHESAGSTSLVPLIVSTTSHQRDNALFMAQHGAALHLPQTELNATSLATLLRGMDRPTLLAMAQKARALSRPRAAARVADEIERLVRRGSDK